jgi:protoheme IX farnesyltransferase
MASYALAPITASTPPSSLTTLLATATGTFLCSASANTLNQIFEAPMDAQMSRTRTRPLARRVISTHHASVFATISGLSGSVMLATMVNPTTALLGLTNLILYSFMYTPLKRISVTNTWLGALVGGLPALMGSTAAGASLSHPASWITAALLYVWQFPHFNSLAHSLRRDYARAGYRMMANLYPAMNARVSLRYAIATLPLSSWLVPYYGLTTPTFALLSLIPNLALIFPAFRLWIATPHGPLSHKLLNSIASSKFHLLRSMAHFSNSWQSKTRQEQEAKKLFWASLIHLPTLLILMMACRTSESDSSTPQENLSTPS